MDDDEWFYMPSTTEEIAWHIRFYGSVDTSNITNELPEGPTT